MQFSTLATIFAIATAAIAAPTQAPAHEPRNLDPRDCRWACLPIPNIIAKAACYVACNAMAKGGESVEEFEDADFAWVEELEKLKKAKDAKEAEE